MMLLLCIAALLVASVKSECPNSDYESILHPGYEYFYNFQTQAVGEAVGTTNDRSKLSLNCEVHISHAYECYFTLKLQQCALTAVGGSPGSEAAWIDNKPLSELSRHPLLFAIDNGKVTEILTAEEDPVHLVNIKRGALSAFVFKLSATVNEVKELQTDVHGVCPVTSIPLNSEDGTVKTSKDMLHCAFPSRPDWQLSPWSIFWNMSFIQYVINSTTDCDYKIDISEKRIENVFCKERHAIMLESTHRTTTAVQTNIYYYLKHLRSGLLKDTPDSSSLTRKSSIKFEYVKTPVPRTSNNFMPRAKKMITDLVLDSIEEIRLFSVPQFTELVRLLRTSPNLVPFAEIVKACSFLPSDIACTDIIKKLAMSYMNDALVQCNTAPCFKAISHLAENSDLSPAYLKFVLYSLSNMHFTDPSLITQIINICKIEDMKFCWMVLGTVTRRFYEWNQPVKNEIPQELVEVANHFHDSIGTECNGPSTENYHNLLAYFNAIRNMGKVYSIVIPDGIKQIITCITKEDSPAYLRASAIQMLNAMDGCHDDASCTYMYQKLLPLMMNSSLSLNIRSGAYHQLILTPEHYNFQQGLLKFFMEDNNVELKAYVASSLSDVLSNAQYKKDHIKFVNEMKDLLEENEISLEALIHNPSSESKFSTFASFIKLPFMPEELQKFGVKYQESILYQFYNMIPKAFQSKLTMQLFNKMIDVLQIGGNFEGWEGLAISIQKIIQEVNPKSPSPERIEEIIKEIIRVLSEESVSQSNYLSNDIIDSIKKIQQIYRVHSPQLKQFLNIYFEMFGSTLNFFTSDDILSLPSKIEEIHDFLDLLSEGLVYNTTRMISVIEAYHQVPTLIGLPLNWTTDATLVFSIRRGLKMDYNMEHSEVHANGFYHPSAALTFLNRMVLDFPTITKIGVQANSSAYTSTQWKAEFHYSEDQKIFKIERQDKSQKILELFRTNQLIRHNDAIDIVDWDIERTSSAWCYDGTLASVLGLQLCIDKSYPKVTHLIKPWALMAGWCKWQLVINPFNEEVSAYHIEASKVSLNKSKEVELKIGTTGSSKKQEIVIAAVVDETGEFKFELNTPLLEDFSFFASRKYISENNKISGYKSLVLIKLAEDFQYKVVYNHEDKQEKRREMSAIKNKSSNKKILTFVQERSVELETPYNKYKWDRKVHSSGENKKADASISFENLKPYANWLKTIIPPNFWQTDSKAWLRAQMNWKVLSQQPSDADIQQTSIYVTTPESSAEFLANFLEMSGRQQLTLNATKTETTSRKLLTFANFTYDFWSSDNNQLNSKEISLYNLTLPQKSWALQLQKTKEEDNFLYEMSFTRARMETKNGAKSDYIGWWSNEQEKNFDLEQQQLEFKAKVHAEIIDSGDLVDRYSTLSMNDVQGLKNKLITADIALHLPIYENVESLTFGGYFILSRGSTSFRYQKNFILASSYHNLKLTSHSVYGIYSQQSTLSHNSFFTDMTSGKEAFNIIEYRRSYQPGTCKEVEFKHNIKSEVFDLSTNASYICHSSNLDLHTLLLNMTTYSSYWNALNVNLIQKIKDVNSELTEESVNITHPYMIINVTADWKGQKKDHTKHVIFNSLEESVPSMELNINLLNNGVINMESTILNGEKTKLYYERRMSRDSKNLVVKIGHSDDKNEKSDAVVIKGIIINPLQRIWTGEINTNTYQKMMNFLNSAYQKNTDAFIKVAKDYDHPLNKILKPFIKMSLYDYWKNLKIEFRANAKSIWITIKESVLMMEPFYKPVQIVVANSFYKLMNVISQAFLAVKDKSVTIWAINYFHVPYYVQKYFVNLPQNIREMTTWFLPEDNMIKFELDANKLIEWGSFKEWPTFSIEQARTYFPFFFPEKDPEIKPRYRPADGNKVAMIFGPLHVYTFDGHLYDVPPYASDECAFLLAHDVHKSMFSVLSTADEIHVIFPEMTVTVSSKNEVYINGSNTEHLLPVQADNKKVVVKRGDFIDIWSPSLHIICDGRNLLCTLELSYWHAGGTIGLLGNADGQPHNEYILPDGHVTSSISEFVAHYELSGKPACRNLNSIHIAKPSEEEIQCAAKLSNACPIDKNLQKAFLEPCLTDLRNGHNTCFASSGLSALCYYKVGQGTSKCTVATQESSKIRHKLEVVLIVNQLRSMASNESKNSPHKGLESTIVALDEKFRTNGYSSVLYTLVGFGGKDEHNQPSVYSIGSNPWVPLQKMVNDVIKTLKFEGTDDENNLDSILYALEVMGYDTFDSKVFIMVTDKDKQVAEKSKLDTIQDHLNKNGITLYTFSSYPTIEKGKKVFGVRADGLLFPSPKKEDEAYLDYPKGDLAKLSAGTRGSVFLYKFLKSNSPSSFFQEFAQEVWAKVRKEVHSCRQCKTVKSSWWHSFNECNIVHC